MRSRLLRILLPYYPRLAALVAASGHVIAARDQRDILLHVAFLHNMREESFYAYNPSFWTLAVQAQAHVLMPVVLVQLRAVVGRTRRLAHRPCRRQLRRSLGHTEPGAQSRCNRRLGRVAADGRDAQPAAHAFHFFLGLLAGLIYVRRIAKPDVRQLAVRRSRERLRLSRSV